MKTLIFLLFGYLAVLCVSGGRVGVNPNVKVAITKRVQCSRKSRNGDTLHIHYRGNLADGTEFDDSYKRGHPVIFTIGAKNVIEGWDLGLLDMCEGEKRRLTTPPKLAYGDTGFDNMIPPGATITFETELLHINLRDEL